ncbi:MAG: hypothetical protein IT438_02950 [Phycisphaerales bacterium]|nr:hypothetical protein [Phycisphaerales bacterium]
MTIKSINVRIVSAALLGPISTIAIAWLGAAFEHTLREPHNTKYLRHDTFVAHGAVKHGWFVTNTSLEWTDRLSRQPGEYDVRSGFVPESGFPRWSQAWSKVRPARPPGTWGDWAHESGLYETGAGWPMRALSCEFDEPVQDPVTRGAIYTPRGGFALDCFEIRDGARIFQPRALPCRPIWSGLLVNSTLMAMLWFAPLSIPALRRILRRRAGRCQCCGYDLRGLSQPLCPECGRVFALPATTVP